MKKTYKLQFHEFKDIKKGRLTKLVFFAGQDNELKDALFKLATGRAHVELQLQLTIFDPEKL